MSNLNELLAAASDEFDAPRVVMVDRGQSRRAIRKALRRREQVERATRTVWYAMRNNPDLTKAEAVRLVTPGAWVILSFLIKPLIAMVAEWVWEQLTSGEP